jgi:Zn-dependent M28 family amino/carboxypeptidase
MRFGTGAASILIAGVIVTACQSMILAPETEIDVFGPDAVAAATTIDAQGLRNSISTLASDDFGGRGPASAGDQLTQEYLSAELARIGYAPAGANNSWLQPFDIVSVTTTTPDTWRFANQTKTLDLKAWDDFIAASGTQNAEGVIDVAELVFVGYGIKAPEYDWDDYKDTDVSGKLLLMLNNDPDWDPAIFEGDRRLYYGRWTYKYEMAARLGAAGAIIIHTTPSAGYPFQVVQTSWTGAQYKLPADGAATSALEAWVTEDAAAALVSLGGHNLAELIELARSRDFSPQSLGTTTSLQLDNTLSRETTANVAGWLEGRDPILKDEFIVLTAHHDHLGIGEPDANGDTIYNGALDNAAGVAQVLAISDALAALPLRPRRSILVLFVAAEEQGLLGSQFYAQNPSIHTGRLAANVNLDGGNIWGRTRDITYIGYGKSSLDDDVETAASFQGRTVQGDQFPDQGYFYRSDQFNFAKIGVPAVYLDGGTDYIGRPDGWGTEQVEEWVSVRYHQPSDELEADWNFDGLIEDAQLAFYIALSIAEADEMPRWNEGDEFEAARLDALAARE